MSVCGAVSHGHRCEAEGPHTRHVAENAGEGGADYAWNDTCDVCAREKGEIGVRVDCAVCHMIKKPRGRSVAMESANALCDSECPGYDAAPRVGDLWPGELRWTFGYGVPDDESDRCHRKPGGDDADDAECYRLGHERLSAALVNIRKLAREAVGTREYEDIEEACDAALAQPSSPDTHSPTEKKSGADTRT